MKILYYWKEKIFIEIELLLSEIELNHNNYKESLNHINLILNIQSMKHNDNNNIEINNMKESKKISKSKNIMNLTKNSESTKGIIDDDNKTNENKFMLNMKNSVPSDSSKLFLKKKKNENDNNNNIYTIINKIKNLNYHLSSFDKNRINLILEQIANKNN